MKKKDYKTRHTNKLYIRVKKNDVIIFIYDGPPSINIFLPNHDGDIVSYSTISLITLPSQLRFRFRICC